jgi:hypothetical protein
MIVLVVLALPSYAIASSHGPVFGLATPTNSQGEWSFDQGVFDRTTSLGSQASICELVGYGWNSGTVHAGLILKKERTPAVNRGSGGAEYKLKDW